MYRKRTIEKILSEAVEQFAVTVVSGPRQSGKSTLLEKLFPKYNYVLLDELDLRTFARKDPRGFLEQNKAPLIIDEIQNEPSLLPYIKSIIHKEKRKGMYILTGSQQFQMMTDVKESLGGRAAILNLMPFSVNELYSDKKTINWSNAVLEGFYPEPSLDKKINKRLWFESYITTVLDKDIRINLNKEQIKAYDEFLQIVSARVGKEINSSKIASTLGVKRPSVQTWIALLEKSQLIYILKPYYRSFGKRLVKSPKLYFTDTGIVSHLTGHSSSEQVQKSILNGLLFENLILCEILKYFYHRGEKANIYFIKDNHEFEVDFIIESQNKILAIEAKVTATPNGRHVENLNKFKAMVLKDKNTTHNIALRLVCNRREEISIDGVKTLFWTDVAKFLDEEFG